MTSSHPEAAAPAGTTTTEVLAHKLRLLRRAAHLTLQQLGARSGIATSTLSPWFRRNHSRLASTPGRDSAS